MLVLADTFVTDVAILGLRYKDIHISSEDTLSETFQLMHVSHLWKHCSKSVCDGNKDKEAYCILPHWELSEWN